MLGRQTSHNVAQMISNVMLHSQNHRFERYFTALNSSSGPERRPLQSGRLDAPNSKRSNQNDNGIN